MCRGTTPAPPTQSREPGRARQAPLALRREGGRGQQGEDLRAEARLRQADQWPAGRDHRRHPHHWRIRQAGRGSCACGWRQGARRGRPLESWQCHEGSAGRCSSPLLARRAAGAELSRRRLSALQKGGSHQHPVRSRSGFPGQPSAGLILTDLSHSGGVDQPIALPSSKIIIISLFVKSNPALCCAACCCCFWLAD